MEKTTTADGHSPAISLEPGEFIRCFARISASCGKPETTYLVNTAMRVGKCVLVGAMHFDAFIRVGYHQLALAAENVFAGIRFFLFGFIFNIMAWLFRTIFFSWLSKKITVDCITVKHFSVKKVRCLLLIVTGSFFAS